MLLDEMPSPSDHPTASEPTAGSAAPGDNREAVRLRELALWYRVFAERAGNPTISEARLHMAEELEREADRVPRVNGESQPVVAESTGAPRAIDPRTRILLEAPILPTLLRLAWPNIAVMLVMASTGLIETWWVSRLGTDALAGIALVFPLYMMMQMMSAGAMDGGISSAIARALGGGRRADADALVLHALAVAIGFGLLFMLTVLGGAGWLYRAMGGSGASLTAALTYSNVVFSGAILIWVFNSIANVIRGTGNMIVPAVITSVGAALLIPLSPCLIFGWG